MADPSPGQRSPWSLQTRTAALISVALVPIGALTVLFANDAFERAENLRVASLAAQTAQAAAPEREAIVAAFGTANGMAASLGAKQFSETECRRLMERVGESSENYEFIGFVDDQMASTCNNFGQRYDFSDNAGTRALYAAPRRAVSFRSSGRASGAAVMIVSVPVFDAGGEGDALLGYVSISFPVLPARDIPAMDPIELITFNEQGELLTTRAQDPRVEDLLPRDMRLVDMVGLQEQVFEAESASGVSRKYAIVPIVPDRAYALGILLRGERAVIMPLIASGAMWLATLGVAFFVLRAQVISPIAGLQSRMKDFAQSRRLEEDILAPTLPQEVREISATFHEMSFQILRDEAEAEDSLREREQLLQEINHRVSNNLQLMSSILNMQLRKADDPGIQNALQAVQGRFSSLARFHHELYQNDFKGMIPCASMLKDLVDQLLQNAKGAGLSINADVQIGPLELLPDQASHLALYLFETVSSRLEVLRASKANPFRFSVRLDSGDGSDGTIQLTVTSTGKAMSDTALNDPISEKLIDAFAAQLEGEAQRSERDGVFTQTLVFRRLIPSLASRKKQVY